MIGDSFSVVTATIVSSTSSRPSSTRPCLTSVALLHHGERGEVSIAEPLADPAGLCGDGGCGLVIAGQHLVVKGR
jgi:hypothetical protein